MYKVNIRNNKNSNGEFLIVVGHELRLGVVIIPEHGIEVGIIFIEVAIRTAPVLLYIISYRIDILTNLCACSEILSH